MYWMYILSIVMTNQNHAGKVRKAIHGGKVFTKAWSMWKVRKAIQSNLSKKNPHNIMKLLLFIVIKSRIEL